MVKSTQIKTSANTASSKTSINNVGSSGNSASQEDLSDLEKKFYNKLEEYDKKSDDRQIKAIEALGIFVALFSFISISIQIFNRISSAWSAGLFVLLIFCSLSLMIILLDLLLIRSPININGFSHDFRFYLILLFVLIGVGSIISLRQFSLNSLPGTVEFEEALDKKVDNKINILIREQSYQKSEIDNFITESKNDTRTLKDCLKSGGWNKCFQ